MLFNYRYHFIKFLGINLTKSLEALVGNHKASLRITTLLYQRNPTQKWAPVPWVQSKCACRQDPAGLGGDQGLGWSPLEEHVWGLTCTPQPSQQDRRAAPDQSAQAAPRARPQPRPGAQP